MAIDVIKTGTGEAPKELARLMFPNDGFTMAACLYRERFTIEVVAIAKNKGERDQTWAIRLDCLTGQGILEAKRVWSLLSRGFEQMPFQTLSWVNLRRENAGRSNHTLQLRERLEHQQTIHFGNDNDVLQISLPSSTHPFKFTGYLSHPTVLKTIMRLKEKLRTAEVDDGTEGPSRRIKAKGRGKKGKRGRK